MKKLAKDLVAGDVIRVEFGEHGNIVVAVVDDITLHNDKYADCEMTVHYKNGGKTTMWGKSNSEIEVLAEETRVGKWIYENKPIHCSECGFTPSYSLNANNSLFCPHCGARMYGDNK